MVSNKEQGEQMLKIALCDNDADVCEQLQNILFQIQDKYGEEYQYEVFNESSMFLKKLEDAKENGEKSELRGAAGYDIIFLDIEMPGASGIDVARFIREEIGDDDVMLVFVSSYTAYALQLFDAHPLDFIVKPVTYENVTRLMEKAYRIMGEGNEYFSFKYNKEPQWVAISKIIYFESAGRKIIIHTAEKDYYFYGKISQLLLDKRLRTFMQIHKSMLVNFKYIARFESDTIELNNKTVLQISRQYRKNVMEKFWEMETR